MDEWMKLSVKEARVVVRHRIPLKLELAEEQCSNLPPDLGAAIVAYNKAFHAFCDAQSAAFTVLAKYPVPEEVDNG